MAISIKSLYTSYIEAKERLKYYKNLESGLRTKVVDTFEIKKLKGTVKQEKSGFLAKATFKTNVNVDDAALTNIWDTLSDQEKNIIAWKPKVIEKEYRALLELKPKSKIFKIIQEKPGAPTVEITELINE